ncbi:DNA repair exonuclease SbcCD nuclease subunit [Pelagirhabdus alkalitolerans]|uniref:DNA repair exonuclease SbcCD nuclease subunit n=1 Tax=Pelagirhabdus alkalitolerans TaxID=1612202 RepID=A0A1G6NCU4_9BACI|nr:DNA repair exonuclease [Pelagirhabdus alkalitolerans]SDC65628.1 DNA repair exonuclease SbcCD nuclease subunit [Pelagirhabdus alkalitolerans]
MKSSLKFIHAADLHLDSPFKGLSNLPNDLYQTLKQSTFNALDHLIDLAIKEDVDFVLMVGDIFDETIQSVYAQMQFKQACQRLDSAGINVYLSYGNHDYTQVEQSQFQLPENVHVFNKESVESVDHYKDHDILATIHGFSYINQAVWENKTDEYIPTSSGGYQIGMLHGSAKQSEDHDHYAPFSKEELINKGFDYWALGHIHKRMELHDNPHIVYPGNIQGRSRKESGSKGCYLVEQMDHDFTLSFHKLNTVRFQTIEINSKGCERLDDLYQLIEQEINVLEGESTIITLYLENTPEIVRDAYYEGALSDLIAVLNDTFANQTNWRWIEKIMIEHSNVLSEAVSDPFIQQLKQAMQDIDWEQEAKPLWRHPQARKYLDAMDDKEKESIQKEAESLALFHLLGGEHDEN